MRSLAVLLALAGVMACRGSFPTDISSQSVQSQEVVVALRDTVSLGTAGIRIGFREVSHDSRCPVDAVCTTAGWAEITLDLMRPGGADGVGVLVVGHSGTTSRSLVFGGYLIELQALDPEPVVSRPNPAYQARLHFRFLPD